MILMPFSGPAMMLSCSSDTFDDDRRRHAARGAHGDESIAAARAFELVERSADQDRAGRADRVTERNRAAVDVNLCAGHKNGRAAGRARVVKDGSIRVVAGILKKK